MIQESKPYQEPPRMEAEALFEIDFDAGESRRLDEDDKQRIYQELMSLDW